MKYTIDFNRIKAAEIFERAIECKNKDNFFSDLRRIFREVTNELLKNEGINLLPKISHDYTGKLVTKNSVEFDPIKSKYKHDNFLDLNFCAGYGTSNYSLSAINYQSGGFNQLTSLHTFYKIRDFSIGNFAFFVENGDYEIQIKRSDETKIVGYSFDISKRKRKSFIAILGVHFCYDSLRPIFERYYQETEELDLDEVRFGSVKFPILFACRRMGKIYTCRCFEGYIDWKWDFWRFSGSIENEPSLKRLIERIEYKDKICHLCNGGIPKLDYGSSMYFSSFLQKYLPYYNLENKKRFNTLNHLNKKDKQQLEDELRVRFGYPRIGQKWISETVLYQLINDIFTEHEVVFHYRGKELDGLEIDIWIPALKLGIEYQGEQHFKSISHWGGQEGLKKRQENDLKKKKICKELGYDLVEFMYNEKIKKDVVLEKLGSYL